jgi:hypothetical protein
MKHNLSAAAGAVILLASLGGCDKFGLGNKAPVPDGAPDEQALQKISYMSAADAGVKGRKLYNHVEEAKTCGDFELAMRWNRPPNIESGPFHKKIVYLTGTIPADLRQGSEVFITAKIEKGETLPSGSAVWLLRMSDGTAVQAVETADFWEKEEQATQEGKFVAIVNPTTPGRAFCGQGVYQGLVGKEGDQKKVPVVSALFAMDRDK